MRSGGLNSSVRLTCAHIVPSVQLMKKAMAFR